MKRILVAYNGGDEGRRALETAIELARAFGATVSVVSVVPLHPGPAPVDPWDDREAHASELLRAREILLEAGIEAELLEPYGSPAPMIEQIADERDFDMIVVGPRERSAIGRLLAGSVSRHVAANASRTVVVAR